MYRDPRYRFIVNTDPRHYEVHDLNNEQTGENECQIDEIIEGDNYEYIKEGNTIDDLERWLRLHPEYDGCMYCLPEYHED